MMRRLGAVGTVLYPTALDPRSGDVRTWSAIGEFFDDITVIAQTAGFRPRRQRVGNVLYILLPRLPRAADLVAFPLGATLVAFVLYARGVRTWSFSDPLRSGLVCLAMRCLPGVHLVVHLQGQLLRMPSNRFGKSTALVEGLSSFVVRRADTVRVVSRQIARDAAAAGVQPNRIAVIPSRCDTQLFDPDRWRKAGKALRSSFPGDPASPVVGFLGSFNASKGLDVLVTAASNLAQRRPVRLAIAGDGPLRRQLESAAVRGLPPMTLLGRLSSSDVPRFLSAIDVLAVPSYDEGLPRAVLEAMAMRTPVVASRVGGIPEAVQDGSSGLLVQAGDAEALAAALNRVLDDPALASRLGDAGRRRVLERFDARSGWRRLAAVHVSDPPSKTVRGAPALAALGAAAELARRAGLGRALGVAIDTIDGRLLRAGRPPLAAKVDSIEFRGYLRHRGFLEYLAQGMTEERYYRRLVLGEVDSQTTFVDAGAHIGVYTLLVCRRARRVLAFEPDPYNLAALQRNVTRGGCANVEIHAKALAERAGRAPFRAFRSTFSGSLLAREVDAYRELEIDLACLDDVLDDSDLASLVVKLDVEGAEPLAIAGMRNTILRSRRLVVFAEVNPEALEAGGSSSQRLVEVLLTAGMECAFVDEENGVLLPLREAGPLRKGNLRCRKASDR